MTIPYIPYFQTSRYRVKTMVELANVKPGEYAADLGCGDGRITIALAKAGAIATGYDLNDDLLHLAKENIQKEFPSLNIPPTPSPQPSPTKVGEGDQGVVVPTILKKDFWYEDLSKYSIICCYPMPAIMGRLEKKLQEELRPGSRVLLNYFPFLHWKLTTTKDNIFLYKK